MHKCKHTQTNTGHGKKTMCQRGHNPPAAGIFEKRGASTGNNLKHPSAAGVNGAYAP